MFTLEAIVEKFGEDIAPFAVQMTQQLSAAFWKYVNSEDEEDDDDVGGWVGGWGRGGREGKGGKGRWGAPQPGGDAPRLNRVHPCRVLADHNPSPLHSSDHSRLQ